jgi:hypothetical protein
VRARAATVVCAVLAAALMGRVSLLLAAVDHDLEPPEERSRPADHDRAAEPPG